MNTSEIIQSLLRPPIHEAFDDDVDKWFGLVAKFKKDPGLQSALVAARGKPTRQAFDAFKKAIQDVGQSQVKKSLVDFTKNISNGNYSSEFSKFEGHGSVIAELFSVFRQAMS